ncbi:MAG: PAS domain-containing sensor histidine kinase, partial [Verrucomicrobiota bacterium]
ELQRSNTALQKQAEILANIHDAVFLIGPDGNLQSWNRGAEAIYGYSAEEILGQPADQLLPPEDIGRCERIMKAVAKEQHTEEMVWCVTKTGRRIAVAIRATQSVGEGQSGVVICARDITEQKRLEEQVLHASEKEQRRIGQDIHDDLCQQLASIGCLTKVLEQRLRDVYDEGAQHLSQIGDMVSQANVRAREIARGLIPAVLETEGLIGALEDLANTTEQIYAPVKCRLRTSKRLKLGSEKELVQLFRIAQEAVNNAVKHAAPKLITIHLFEEGSNIRLRIHDDGQGIQEPDSPSSGLGLLTMAHRARTLGGEFEIHTTEENGTTVECLVPFS